MPQLNRRQSDEDIIEMKTDIKGLKKESINIRKSVDALTDTMGDFMHENQEEHTRLTRGLFGDPDFNEEGLVNKSARHEETISKHDKDITKFKTTMNVLKVIAGILGISTIYDIIGFIGKVLAAH